MERDEQDILDYLKCWPEQYVSAREICRRAGGKWRFRSEPDWAMPILARMAEKGILEKDSCGHYRLAAVLKAGGKDKYKWIPPQVRKILAQGNPHLTQVFELDEDAAGESPETLPQPSA